MEIKENIYHDYLLVKKMKADISTKSIILKDIISKWEDFWKIIGITKNALKVFSDNDFKKKRKNVAWVGSNINRAHIKQDRIVTNTYLLTNDLSFDEFWDYLIENDKTILATSTENKTNTFSEIIPIDPLMNLFKKGDSHGIGWKHNKSEINFLKSIS
jgi:hypothetical protein